MASCKGHKMSLEAHIVWKGEVGRRCIALESMWLLCWVCTKCLLHVSFPNYNYTVHYSANYQPMLRFEQGLEEFSTEL